MSNSQQRLEEFDQFSNSVAGKITSLFFFSIMKQLCWNELGIDSKPDTKTWKDQFFEYYKIK